ncbi:enteropeptidase-like [Amphiura filiformis]|uniref:enteropeptidase-like n=1 Tax=Amphiura filiformis TaxID=82378 RepID=UPI003B220679
MGKLFGDSELPILAEKCHPSEIACKSGSECIHWSLRCDGYMQCADGSDEQQCSCETSNYTMFIGGEVNLSSPGFPNRYPPNQQCLYYFNAPDQASYSILIEQLILVDLLGNGVQSRDIFLLGNGSVTGQHVIFPAPRYVAPGTAMLIGHRQMWLIFQSDYVYHQKGFRLHISRVPVNTTCHEEEIFCNSGESCYKDTLFYTGIIEPQEAYHIIQICRRCRNEDFWCRTGTGCIRQEFVCDNHMHCLDGSDEFDCRKFRVILFKN